MGPQIKNNVLRQHATPAGNFFLLCPAPTLTARRFTSFGGIDIFAWMPVSAVIGRLSRRYCFVKHCCALSTVATLFHWMCCLTLAMSPRGFPLAASASSDTRHRPGASCSIRVSRLLNWSLSKNSYTTSVHRTCWGAGRAQSAKYEDL